MNTTSLTKMQRELVAVTEELDRLAAELAKLRERAEKAEAELQKMREQKPVGQVQESSPSNKWPVMRTLGEFPPIGTFLFAGPVPAPAVPAPSVPEEWREKLLAGFPLLDEEGLCQEKHHCEWTLLQDRKRLHALLQSDEVTK